MPEVDHLVEMSDITKTFPGVTALSNVDFSLRKGEIHAIMGENGAGKSTLIKVLTGVEHQDNGEIYLEGKPISARSPQHAQELGISTVYQEVNLCPNLSVAENIFIGREPKKFARIDWKQVNERSAQILKRMDVDIDVSLDLNNFSIAIQQMVAIARALNISAKVLILDEPTSSLDMQEVETLFHGIRQLKGQGLGIIFITHFIDQMYEISDRITVLRNGIGMGCFDTGSLSRMELVSTMIGKNLDDLESLSQVKASQTAPQDQAPVVETKDLGKSGSIQPFDLDLKRYEVLGLAGLLGSGRTEIARLLFGIDQPDSGSLKINGKKVKKNSPLKSIWQGVGLCPENRKADGVVDDLTVRENLILALQSGRGWFKKLSRKKQEEIAEKYIELLDISTPGTEQLVRNLSGGNQQKVILGRWLATDADILILDEPTRGIDIGTKAEIQKLILSLAENGKGIIFISSELDEVVRCCSRVKVLRDREMVAELSGDEVNETQIMQAIAGN